MTCWTHVSRLVLLCSISLSAAGCGGPDEPPEPACGDGVCDAGEGCDTCEADCGPCCTGCDEHAACEAAGDAWACVCGDGYEGDGATCADVDECAEGLAGCDELGTCVNTPGGYRCDCPAGYEAEGDACRDVDECAEGSHDCAPTATCVDEEGAYRCTCAAEIQANCYRTLRALALVVDFADAELEGYESSDPDAFTTEDAIEQQLEEMSAHWSWMSLGTREMVWDLARVQLEAPLAAGAFPDWGAFRAAAVAAARETVDFADYDRDGDGVFDVMWIIASSRELEYDYLIGGMARTDAVANFVDGQGSMSVRSAATGNYNHEVGHCLGLPDVYGDYDTLGFLSLMSDSWPVPPFGFSAFDRLLLAWAEPIVVAETTSGVVLGPAEDALEAALIPTSRPWEYFMVEHRRRPEEGYGSRTGVRFDGLAIYHVYDARRAAGGDFVDPPLIRLEPANGLTDEAPEPPEASDFWSPENTDMIEPFVGRTYASLEPMVRLEGITRTADGRLSFDVIRLPVEEPELPNLLANGDVEQGEGDAPAGWDEGPSSSRTAELTWEQGSGRDGSACLRITATSASDTVWEQEVTGLVPGRTYELRGWVRGEAIEGAAGVAVGANLSLLGAWDRTPGPGMGTFDWTQVAFAFTAQAETATIGCRLGHWWSEVTGTAWFDDLALVELP